jgi:hypothetical protein
MLSGTLLPSKKLTQTNHRSSCAKPGMWRHQLSNAPIRMRALRPIILAANTLYVSACPRSVKIILRSSSCIGWLSLNVPHSTSPRGRGRKERYDIEIFKRCDLPLGHWASQGTCRLTRNARSFKSPVTRKHGCSSWLGPSLACRLPTSETTSTPYLRVCLLADNLDTRFTRSLVACSLQSKPKA